MPGAPNRPPESAPAPPAPAADEYARRVLRRLAASRVALSLDVWKGAPSPELVTPYENAEAAYANGDWREAESRLDALSVRFAEPRWPTLPEPFRQLRVATPAPQPPQWDPEFTLTPEEKQARKAHRALETQVALAQASLEWAQKKGIDVRDLAGSLSAAAERMTAGAPPAEVYSMLDPFWETVRTRVPLPKALGRPSPAPAPPREPHPEET